jgi:hypothetical protein
MSEPEEACVALRNPKIEESQSRGIRKLTHPSTPHRKNEGAGSYFTPLGKLSTNGLCRTRHHHRCRLAGCRRRPSWFCAPESSSGNTRDGPRGVRTEPWFAVRNRRRSRSCPAMSCGCNRHHRRRPIVRSSSPGGTVCSASAMNNHARGRIPDLRR